MPDGVENPEIWQDAMKQTKAVYEPTRSWPEGEPHGLTSRARRAAVSVAANLAEGLGGGTSGEIARFAQLASGSLYDLDALLRLVSDLRGSPQDVVVELREQPTSPAKRASASVQYQESRSWASCH